MPSRSPWYTIESLPPEWEEHYRQVLRIDRLVRTTHGVDCGGACEVEVGVRDGVVVWERPAESWAGDRLRCSRYCSRAPATADYLDPARRLSEPLVRGRLWELWRGARAASADPCEAWRAVSGQAAAWKDVRGSGAFTHVGWSDVLELVAASVVESLRCHGAEAVAGCCTGPGRALVAAASGRRFLSLLGAETRDGAAWEEDARAVLRGTLGDEVDCPEAEAWREAALLAVLAEDFTTSASPDFHLLQSARDTGAPLWLFDEVPSPAWRHADQVVPLPTADLPDWWRCVCRRLMEGRRNDPARTEYLVCFTDAPLLLALVETPVGFRIAGYARPAGASEGPYLVWDRFRGEAVPAPGGPGSSSLRLVHPADGRLLEPSLTTPASGGDSVLLDRTPWGLPPRRVPVLRPEGAEGPTWITVWDYLQALLGAGDPDDHRYTPAWFEARTGVPAPLLSRFADLWEERAEYSGGRCMVLAGRRLGFDSAAAVVQAVAWTLMVSGCFGRPGGGFGWYSGQRKVIPRDSWELIASAGDWLGESRAASAPIPTAECNPESVHRPRTPTRVLFRWLADSGCETWSPQPDHRRQQAATGPEGHQPELVVDLNFHLDLPALYADIVLPATTWYEKEDLNSSERSGKVVAQVAVVPPLGGACSEWEIFARLADACADVAGRCESPAGSGIEPTRLGSCYRSLGPRSPLAEQRRDGSTSHFGQDSEFPGCLARPVDVCRTILALSSATCGPLAAAGLRGLRSAGADLEDLEMAAAGLSISWEDLREGGRRPLPNALWTGLDGRPYTPFLLNVRHSLPWATSTGRMQFWIPGCPEPATTGSGGAQQTAGSGFSPTAALSRRPIPLRLVTVQTRLSYGTVFADLDLLSALTGPDRNLWIHPLDAETASLGDGEWAVVEWPGHLLLVRTRLSGWVRQGTVLLDPPLAPQASADCPVLPWGSGCLPPIPASAPEVRLRVWKPEGLAPVGHCAPEGEA